MHSPSFKNTLNIEPLNPSTNNVILLLNANDLDVSQYNLPDYLSPFELQVINRRKSAQAKQEYLATRLLLKYLVKTTLPTMSHIALPDISSEFHQPSSKLRVHIERSEVVINCCISHSHGLVGAALNPTQCQFGFDIEKISLQRPFEKLAKHFYHADEVAQIAAPDDALNKAQLFFRIWTLKEALAKATSRPIAKLLSPNVFAELQRVQLNANSAVVEDFDISVVHEKSTAWQCSVVTLALLSSSIIL